ncbi:MAG: hypothetical protein LBH93_02500 [Chitinispirillales bacterium]|jgi:hypothetical protein|nr:hypothetical protein [Chitinispirillales bacterium]
MNKQLMTDKAGRVIERGDVVRIVGAYTKRDNGLYRVASAPGDANYTGNDYTLRRINLNGSDSEGTYTTKAWPLRSYRSDRREARNANAHDSKCAVIEIERKGREYRIAAVADYFPQASISAVVRAHSKYDAENVAGAMITIAYREEAWRGYTVTVEPVDPAAEPEPIKPKYDTAAEPAIKFAWNGIKINGKLYKGKWYMFGDSGIGAITYYADSYIRLPVAGTGLPIVNRSDSMTDYYETDRMSIPMTHKRYADAKAAFAAAAIHAAKRTIAWMEKHLASGRVRCPSEYKMEINRARAKLAEMEAA